MFNPYKNSTVTVNVACAVFFLIFSFCYLYSYQADVLAAAQHVLSKGQTHYDRTIGAVLITLVAWLLQLVLFATFRLRGYFLALSFLPSLLLLGALTDADDSLLQGHYGGPWLWAYPLTLVIWGGLAWFCRQYESIHRSDHTSMIHQLWVNMAQMVVMAAVTCAVGNSDRVFHYRMQAERGLLEGNCDEVLQIGYGEEATDSSLTLLRIWALSEKHQLGERLFEYPVVGGADAMKPNGKSVRLIMLPERKYYNYMGVRFVPDLDAMTYLQKIHERHRDKPHTHDWLLTAYLLEGRLDDFVATLPRYYDPERELPKHYCEALTLYTHQKANPTMVYHNSVMDADYEDFQAMRRKHKNPSLRDGALRQTYGKSYWYYYYQLKQR